jgi:hypothetical protein
LKREGFMLKDLPVSYLRIPQTVSHGLCGLTELDAASRVG